MDSTLNDSVSGKMICDFYERWRSITLLCLFLSFKKPFLYSWVSGEKEKYSFLIILTKQGRFYTLQCLNGFSCVHFNRAVSDEKQFSFKDSCDDSHIDSVGLLPHLEMCDIFVLLLLPLMDILFSLLYAQGGISSKGLTFCKMHLISFLLGVK